MFMRSVNPATGEELDVLDTLSEAGLEEVLSASHRAFRSYRATAGTRRAGWLENAADLLEARKRELAELMTAEMGKPLTQATSEVEKCAWVCRHYAEHGPGMLADEPVETEAERSFVRYEPLGPVLAVMPWNFPFWQVFRFAAPALMAGNVALLKHAPSVPRCAVTLEEIFREAGFPDGVFQTLLLEEERVEGVIDDRRVRAVTLTGSVGAGKAVAAAAGARVKKTVLELGGSDPFLVLPSADLDRAVETAVRARTQNSGQSCIAAKRFILHRKVADAFTGRFVSRMEELTVGDPMEEDTDVGPLAAPHVLEGLVEQVRRTVDAGARVLTGGEPLEGPGLFFPPTVLADVPEGTPARDEELFGPVAALFTVPDLEAAIRLANDTTFGLGASAWTTDPEERERLVNELEAGAVFVNGMVASDPRLPFGGVKESGYGRELGRHGIREFVNVKTVSVHS